MICRTCNGTGQGKTAFDEQRDAYVYPLCLSCMGVGTLPERGPGAWERELEEMYRDHGGES